MRVALISDSHGTLPDPEALAGADAVFHAGDVSVDRGQQAWLVETLFPWVAAVGVPVHLTWGNHDNPETSRVDLAPPNLHVHVDALVEVGGEKVWFSPWSPRLPGWYWTATEEDLADTYAGMPADTSIIVSHAPPYGVCDRPGPGMEPLGSRALADAVRRRPSVKLVVCGHIHGGHGTGRLDHAIVRNVALKDERYQPVFAPTWTVLEDEP